MLVVRPHHPLEHGIDGLIAEANTWGPSAIKGTIKGGDPPIGPLPEDRQGKGLPMVVQVFAAKYRGMDPNSGLF